ncbi:protein kinase domain-containing protein, partial [Lactobacillus delbrueckii]|uniref:protein kinase domain-containing protein n=2 Tax=Lactobacillus delbrueckii TaxID=1584 RepID=UPI004057F866
TPNLTAFTGVDSQNLPDVMVSVQFILAIGEKLKPSSNVEKIYDYRLERYNSLPTRYLILKAIKQNGPSGVLLALDLQTKLKVIIRYADKYYNIESAGIDERDRLISASSLLEKDFVRNSSFFETVVDSFYVNDAFFVVTEYASGYNLDELAKNGQLGLYSLSERLEIFRNVLIGIYVLNDNLIIFRDLSFSNVILCPNHTIKIIDFGYAISLSGLSSFAGLTLNSAGTYGFFDPEMTIGKKQLDLYSLGKFLYYIVFPQSYLNYTSKINSDSTYWQIKEYVSDSEQYQLPERIAELYRLLIKGEKIQETDFNYLLKLPTYKSGLVP